MLKSRKFWAYEPCQNADIKQEYFDTYKIKGRFYDDAIFFYDQLGIAPHPSMRMPTHLTNAEISTISFINNQIDIITIKILLHLLPYTKIISLKFCSNDFEMSNFEYLITNLISKQNNIYHFSYEWNDKLKLPNNFF